ncbi:HEAT repeat domain-containing protein [Leptospira borgpetersenii]|uniref:HEAT repeat domain-containing protein n=1 Tax=Leptospira borgpetersenii TaxID=174 RepID=UPI00187E363C|nr:HEAT repeat domain-containing protein [Leptospira borgpetersenii]MBE8399806.1 HEAT repeat domain-containing protein [Leptospira borgpetersenii serovar Tarassovi]MBE8402957.1 HEAT repeat domain-containing protein [Leptospira borgpetersenii serovar Tarassovi]MBE8405683.1 HEAT repeat domain-containing protein [Leptospira borgpetersenii serovar Tarassovi]MBE8411809.1 HEAT repeat domain-containing protein [Leptospira borgpetersenii serovar Tarassovi]MBE8415509.1 HEAT repeat domain-containing pro
MNSAEKSKNWKNKINNSNKRPKKAFHNFVKYILFFAYTIFLLFVKFPVFSAPDRSKSTKLSEEQLLKKKEILLQVLKFGTTKERAMALRELEEFPSEHSGALIEQLGKILDRDPDWMMRVYAIRTVSELKLTQYEESILKLLKNEQPDIQRESIYATKKLKFEKAAPILFEILKAQDFTKNSNLIVGLLDTLGGFPSQETISSFLLARLNENFNDPEIRAQIALFFGKNKDKKAESALLEIYKDSKEPITLRSFSVSSLGKMKSISSMQAIQEELEKIRNLKSKNEIKALQPLKIHSITALVSMGDKDILEELYAYARDDDPVVRLRAIKHLTDTGDMSVLEILEYKAQRDPSEKVKKAAKAAIEKLKKGESGNDVDKKGSDSSKFKTSNKERPIRSENPLPGTSNAVPDSGSSPSGGGNSPSSGGKPESEDLED